MNILFTFVDAFISHSEKLHFSLATFIIIYSKPQESYDFYRYRTFSLERRQKKWSELINEDVPEDFLAECSSEETNVHLKVFPPTANIKNKEKNIEKKTQSNYLFQVLSQTILNPE